MACLNWSAIITYSIFYSPKQPFRVFNTWMGDPGKMIILGEVLKVIKRDSLLQNVRQTGDVLMKGLLDYQKKYSGLIHSTRGLGTFISFDLPTTAQRDAVITKLKNKGNLSINNLGTYLIQPIPSFLLIFFCRSSQRWLRRQRRPSAASFNIATETR